MVRSNLGITVLAVFWVFFIRSFLSFLLAVPSFGLFFFFIFYSTVGLGSICFYFSPLVKKKKGMDRALFLPLCIGVDGLSLIFFSFSCAVSSGMVPAPGIFFSPPLVNNKKTHVNNRGNCSSNPLIRRKKLKNRHTILQ